jgi:hypothetical protein
MRNDVFTPRTSQTTRKSGKTPRAQRWPYYATQVAKGSAQLSRGTAKSAVGLDNQAKSLRDLAKQGIDCIRGSDLEGAEALFNAIINAMATQRHIAIDIMRDSTLVATQLERALKGDYDVDTQLERDGNGDK